MAGSDLDARNVLRDKLKIALQDVRKLYDEGLLDENEFKDLKSNELLEYKEQLSVLVAAEAAAIAAGSPMDVTPPRSRFGAAYAMPAEGSTGGHLSTPPHSTPPPLPRSKSKSTPTASNAAMLRSPVSSPQNVLRSKFLGGPSSSAIAKTTNVPTSSTTPPSATTSLMAAAALAAVSTPVAEAPLSSHRTPPHSAPPRFRSRAHETVYLNTYTFRRLTTPPIFRRRPLHRRRIIVPKAELDAIEEIRGSSLRPSQ